MPLKPCPYRAEHEFDADGLCVHCFTALPEENILPDSLTPPHEMPALGPSYSQYTGWPVPRPKDDP